MSYYNRIAGFFINRASYALDQISSSNLVGVWSSRRMLSTYTGDADEVRRGDNNSLLNVGFTGENYNTSAMSSHIGGVVDGLIRTRYDQSGNNRNLTQTTNGNQPRIRSAGVNDGINGIVGVRGLNANNTVLVANIGSVNTTTLTLIIVASVSSFVSGNKRIISLDLNGGGDGYLLSSAFNLNLEGTNYIVLQNTPDMGVTLNASTPSVITMQWTGATMSLFINGVLASSVANTNTINVNTLRLFNQVSMNQALDGIIAELVMFSRVLNTTERQLLERNMGNYYGITVA